MTGAGENTVTFEELVPSCSAAHALSFCRRMYEGRLGYVVLTRISATGKHIVNSWAFQASELIGLFEDAAEAEKMNSFVADEGGRWNVYVSCAMHNTNPTDGGKRRGGKQTIEQVHEVRLDLDLKEESFSTPEEIDAFIARFPVAPSLVVDSGIGAKHCYWLLDEEVPRDEGERLNRAWWAYAQEMAGEEIFIDRVHTADRIMRLPGTVRWPKEEGERAAAVYLVGGTGERVPKEDLWKASEAAFYRAEAVRSEVKARADQSLQDAHAVLAEMEDLTGWSGLIATAHVEDIFNDTTSWDEILIPFGWKVWMSDYEGRRHWIRPGKTTGTSATTDYPPSPNVMTLFSNSADRGLVKLDEAGVTLTKFRVYAELKYDGDTAELARLVVAGMRGEG